MANYDAIYQDALDPKPMQVLLNLSNNQKLVLVKMPIALIFNFKLILLLYLMLDLVLITKNLDYRCVNMFKFES